MYKKYHFVSDSSKSNEYYEKKATDSAKNIELGDCSSSSMTNLLGSMCTLLERHGPEGYGKIKDKNEEFKKIDSHFNKLRNNHINKIY